MGTSLIRRRDRS